MTKEEIYKASDVLNTILDNYLHGGEAAEVVTKFEDELIKSNLTKEEHTIPDIVDEHFYEMLGEEPVSEDNNLRKASEEYLKVLSETPYNNTPITNAQTIVRELITFLDNPSKYNPNHIEEYVSEDLDEAAFNYAEDCKYEGGEKLLCIEHFKAGAKWEKEQMMAKAVDTHITSSFGPVLDAPCSRIRGIMFTYEEKDTTPALFVGDNVKLIIIKTD